MQQPRLAFSRTRDAGFTLLETTVCIGIMMMIMGAVFVTNRTDPAAKARARTLFLAACDLARAASGANVEGRSGTMLVVRPTVGGSSLTVLRGRPIREYGAPTLDSTIAPITLPAALTLARSASKEFTIAFAPDGHIDVLTYAVANGAAPIDGRPGCGTAIRSAEEIQFTSARGGLSLRLRCDTGEAVPPDTATRSIQDYATVAGAP